MSKYSDVLGMNTRNVKYLRSNNFLARKIADSKLLSKSVLKKLNVPHPELIAVFKNAKDVNEFDWLSLKKGFVIKPSEGLGGEGIMVVKKIDKYAGEWVLVNNESVNIDDLKLHVSNILEGQYSRNKSPDYALVEERIKIHPKFLKYAYRGTPDIRIIVFNRVPIMAMLRLPTRGSNGKANLHQGAIGLGVDMATGITTYAVHYDYLIKYIPETNKKVNGITIPYWEEILKISVDSQIASGLSYAGIDIILDEEKGPLVIEINDQPGLQIQLANRSGLHARLKRVEDLDVVGKYKGIHIAQLLFAESFSDKVKIQRGQKILGIFETIKLRDGKGNMHDVKVKIDTGAYNVSLDKDLAKNLGLLDQKNILYEKSVESALGKQKRAVVEVDFVMHGVRQKAMATIAKRNHLRTPMLIGRRYLKSFMVDPSRV